MKVVRHVRIQQILDSSLLTMAKKLQETVTLLVELQTKYLVVVKHRATFADRLVEFVKLFCENMVAVLYSCSVCEAIE